MKKVRVDLTGQKFGSLKVLKYSHTYNKRAYWMCKCDCGKNTFVSSTNLKGDLVKTCGCSKVKRPPNKKHGQSSTRLYRIWCAMKNRCYNPNFSNYKYYGGKGIVICTEWLAFENFMEWAYASGYNDSLTIERIDNNKSYTPENCKWIFASEQANNTSQNHFLTYMGKTKTIARWAEELGVKSSILRKRIHRGWPTEKALTQPKRNKQEVKNHD